jgi:molybdopterin-guanine dinucleotide biosynthesis adapter protein
MRVIGLAGWSGAGKTTLILKLIPALKVRGFSVSTLKHAHHHFDVDVKGKDSYQHRMAGANEVLVASKNRFALMRELWGEDEPPLKELLAKLSPVDVVLVEGFKTAAHKKIAIHRTANNKPFIGDDLNHLVGVVSDDDTIISNEQKTGLLRFARNDDIDGVLEIIINEAEPLQELLGRL